MKVLFSKSVIFPVFIFLGLFSKSAVFQKCYFPAPPTAGTPKAGHFIKGHFKSYLSITV